MSSFHHDDARATLASRARQEVLRGPLPGSRSAHGAPVEGFVRRALSAVGLLLGVLVVISVAAAYYAQYSGALRWLLYALLVGIAGALAVRSLRPSIQEPWMPPEMKAAAALGGELATLRTTLRRAQDGLAYSQMLFEDRMREAFLEKVRVNRGVSESQIVAATRDAEAMELLVGDADLSAFVIESARNAREDSRPSGAAKAAAFMPRAAAVLDRMEAWR